MNSIVLIVGISNTILAVIAYLKGTPISRIFSLFAITVAFWCFATFGFWIGDALLWGRMMFLGPILMAPLFLQFAMVFPDKYENFRWSRFTLLLVPAIFFIALIPTDIIVKEIIYPQREVVYGIGNLLFGIYFLIYIIPACWKLIHNWQLSRGKSKRQYQYLFLGIFLSMLIGICTNLILPLVGISKFNRIGPAGTIIFVSFTAYAIIAHRLMDIEVIIKKTVVFSGLVIMAGMVVAILSVLVNRLFSRYVTISPEVMSFSTAMIVIAVYEPLKRILQKVTDRFLFQDKENVLVTLRKLSEHIVTILDLKGVATTILSTLRESLKLESGAIMVASEDGRSYEVVDAFCADMTAGEKLKSTDTLIEYFRQRKRIVNLEEEPEEAHRSGLQRFQGVVGIPLFLHGQMIGILVLGRKKSDELYTVQEMEFFEVLASQAAVALSNARLLEIQKRQEQELMHQGKLAALGTLAAGISHELKNPLNVIRTGVEMLLMNDEFGVYKDYSKEAYQAEVHKVLKSVIEEVERATRIIDTLSELAYRNAEVGGYVEVRESLEKVLALVRHSFEEKKIGLELEFEDNMPMVMGDHSRLEQVFLNVLNNAQHAIGENGKIWVRGHKRGEKVVVEIEDNGPGIPEEIQEKIFDPFFTTKPPGEGMGVGLHLCRVLLEGIKARIYLRSEQGKGATFILEFQAKAEE